jgi:hypothetical protein
MGKADEAISSAVYARVQTWCGCRATAAPKAEGVAGVALVLRGPLAGVALGPWIVDVAAESSWEGEEQQQ